MNPTAKPTGGRYLFIDGLRGLAATSVMLYHFGGHRTMRELRETFADIWFQLTDFGGLGVPIFFVISGFVISNSVRKAHITPKYVGNFALRRSIRLEGPYWVSMAAFIFSAALANRLLDGVHNELPSVGSIIAHTFYVYPFFGYEAIQEIYWTLVHEVQFYLLYVVGFGLVQKFAGDRIPVHKLGLFVLIPTVLLSAAGLYRVEGLCLHTWFMFGMGVLANWYHHKKVSLNVVLLVFLMVAATSIWDLQNYKSISVVTALVTVLASRRGALGKWLSSRALLYLGLISYSTYLIHGVVGWRVLSVADSLGWTSPPAAFGVYLLAIAASLFVAGLMQRFVEKPSLALAAKVKKWL